MVVRYYAFLHSLGYKLPLPTMSRMFSFADVDGDGQLSVNELYAIFPGKERLYFSGGYFS